jgi:hypothetical protein
MKASLLKTIRNPGEAKRGGLNRKVMTFIVCTVLSTFLWFMNVLSEKYTYTIPFQVQYLHMPQDKKLYPSCETVNIKVDASGFNIMAYKLGIKERFINIEAGSFRHKNSEYLYALQSTTHREKIEEQLGEQMKVVDITPDTLYLSPTQPQN